VTKTPISPANFTGLIHTSSRAPSSSLRGEALAPGMKIGLLGGSFDPPHPGHLHLARTAMRRLGLDRVWWLVSPGNPLKTRQPASFDKRFHAVQALADEPGMVVSDIETRLGTSRTIDLVQALQKRHSDVDFVWLMGSDNLAQFHRWARWRDVFNVIPIAVLSRPQDELRSRLSHAARSFARSRICERQAHILPLKNAPAWTYLNEPLHSDSSTQLRLQLKT
jgi:nicotinate-nucleotide adenylyltransferase